MAVEPPNEGARGRGFGDARKPLPALDNFRPSAPRDDGERPEGLIGFDDRKTPPAACGVGTAAPVLLLSPWLLRGRTFTGPFDTGLAAGGARPEREGLRR